MTRKKTVDVFYQAPTVLVNKKGRSETNPATFLQVILLSFFHPGPPKAVGAVR
jgi:hypothetical protein